MNRNSLILSLIIVAAAAVALLYTATKNDHSSAPVPEASHDHETQEDHAEWTVILPEAAQASGIATQQAAPRMLRDTVTINGKMILNPETTADIRARFPGVIRSMQKMVGQSVAKGDVVARVESNDSLQTYSVLSPIAGVVIARNLNVGDTAAEQPLITVANMESVVAELHVFPQDLPRIRVGQTVNVRTADGQTRADGTIKALLPTADSGTQTVIAWVLLENMSSQWRPGMVVQGGAVINEEQVPVAVQNEALQNLDDASVVFVVQANTYTARRVTTGRTDGIYTEITDGLKPGETYVTSNSFIVKADLGKASAEHEH